MFLSSAVCRSSSERSGGHVFYDKFTGAFRNRANVRLPGQAIKCGAFRKHLRFIYVVAVAVHTPKAKKSARQVRVVLHGNEFARMNSRMRGCICTTANIASLGIFSTSEIPFSASTSVSAVVNLK